MIGFEQQKPSTKNKSYQADLQVKIVKAYLLQSSFTLTTKPWTNLTDPEEQRKDEF